uniref:Uncharacterized protein n=1 Tax=Siphoviridae sp. ctXmm2 TaxID=2825546 RepID=A0A8S5QIX0_9CAUD|nr:MAG TPA: hypothetical protein [Siphoviridae sp. ctXmm2]
MGGERKRGSYAADRREINRDLSVLYPDRS